MAMQIESLKYEIEETKEFIYQTCPPVSFKKDGINFLLEDKILKVTFDAQPENPAVARSLVKPILDTWELLSGLNNELVPGAFSFKGGKANIVDPESDSSIKYGECCIEAKAECHVIGYAIHYVKEYPKPPLNFVADSNVKTMLFRYNIFLKNEEPLLSMAYFCLSFLEGLFDGWYDDDLKKRPKVEKYLKVDIEVLKQLGEFTSERGSLTDARKGWGNAFVELTNQEKYWVSQCTKVLIRRLGEYNYDSQNLSLISMKDIPTI